MQFNLWDDLIVQERAKSALEKIFKRNAYPSALIFFGQKGVGKEAHAIAFAQTINCEKQLFQPCGQCERCKRIANFLSPEIYLIYPTPTNPSNKISFLKTNQRLFEKKKLIRT